MILFSNDVTLWCSIHNQLNSLLFLFMNSTNWPAPHVWVFTAQLVEHCSANAEAMGSNPLEVPKFFLLPLRRSYPHFSFYLIDH